MPQALDLAVPELHYGAGGLARLPEILQRWSSGGPVLLIVDRGLAAVGDRTVRLLASSGLDSLLFSDFSSDPSSGQIDAAAQAARRGQAGLVIGIGGGSALDVAKLAAAVAGAVRPAEDYALCRIPLPRDGLPCILLPTTAGTGSEATRTAVFTTAAGAKAWAWGEELRARAALLDPELTLGLPRHLTLATGVDALVHAIEAVTSRRAHPVSDAAALHAIRLVRQALPRVLESPQDVGARGEMLLAAWLAGQAIDLAGTGIAHALGHALGEVGKVHHGRAVGLCLRVALAENAKAAPAPHAAVARAFGLEGESDRDLAERLAPAFSAFIQDLGLDLALPPALEVQRLLEAASREENQPMLQANCRQCTEEDLRALVQAL